MRPRHTRDRSDGRSWLSDSRWPIEGWPRWTPWLIIAGGIALGPLMAYSPWLFAGVAVICLISGFLSDH